jgi:hypothetical protein
MMKSLLHGALIGKESEVIIASLSLTGCVILQAG